MLSIEFEVRPWGRYYVLHDEPNYKLKRIEVLIWDNQNQMLCKIRSLERELLIWRYSLNILIE